MLQSGPTDVNAASKLHENQPYDESLDIPDGEEVASIITPTPQARGGAPFSRGDSPPLAKLSDADNTDEEEEYFNKQSTTKSVFDVATNNSAIRRPKAAPSSDQQRMTFSEDDGTESSDEDDDEDEPNKQEGAYDPLEFENLTVSAEIRDLFQYITRYTPQVIDLDHKLKPFIPDFIPAVGDIDAFIKVMRVDKKPDSLGLTVLDEPCAKQSDPTVLDLQLRAISKQSVTKQVAVKTLENAEKNPKHIDRWITNIQDLHRSKPPASVHYSKNMPDIDTLMQEWPAEFEELLKQVELPSADQDSDLSQYVDTICATLDIPVHKQSNQQSERIQALHILFTLYSEFKNSLHFGQGEAYRNTNTKVNPSSPYPEFPSSTSDLR